MLARVKWQGVAPAGAPAQVSQDLDEEAMRVIKLMPKWIPGIQDGIPVQVQYNMPINFMLQ